MSARSWIVFVVAALIFLGCARFHRAMSLVATPEDSYYSEVVSCLKCEGRGQLLRTRNLKGHPDVVVFVYTCDKGHRWTVSVYEEGVED